MKKLLVILGPTATGKTDLALILAKKFQGELVSADSRQVYKNLDIGTGKLPKGELIVIKKDGWWEINGIKIWMYDVADPKKQYNVSKYLSETKRVLDEIKKSGKLPIIVGGTGLYLKGLLYGFSNLGIPMDKKLRKSLGKLSLDDLQKKLQDLSKEKWESLNSSDQKNPRRLVRAIELVVMQPKRVKSLEARGKDFNILKIGLNVPREVLYKRIDERVKKRIKMGMIEEIRKLYKNGLSLKRMRQLGLEHGVLADYLEGRISSRNDLIQIMQSKIHGYARRQITWFKKEKDVFWFDITGKDYMSKVEKLVAKWYYQSDATKN